jgi:hypothetical protein
MLEEVEVDLIYLVLQLELAELVVEELEQLDLLHPLVLLEQPILEEAEEAELEIQMEEPAVRESLS